MKNNRPTFEQFAATELGIVCDENFYKECKEFDDCITFPITNSIKYYTSRLKPIAEKYSELYPVFTDINPMECTFSYEIKEKNGR